MGGSNSGGGVILLLLLLFTNNNDCLSVCRTEQRDSHQTDNREMTYLVFLQKFVEAFQLRLQLDKNNIHEDLCNCTFISLRE